MKNVDDETSKILTTSQKWERFRKSEEWQMVRDKFMEKLVELSDLSTIDDANPEKLALEISVRKRVLEMLYETMKWMEGEVQAGQFNQKAFQMERRQQIIERYDIDV